MKCEQQDIGNDTIIDFCICGANLCNRDMGPIPTVTTSTSRTTTPHSGHNMTYKELFVQNCPYFNIYSFTLKKFYFIVLKHNLQMH